MEWIEGQHIWWEGVEEGGECDVERKYIELK